MKTKSQKLLRRRQQDAEVTNRRMVNHAIALLQLTVCKDSCGLVNHPNYATAQDSANIDIVTSSTLQMMIRDSKFIHHM